MQAAPAIAGEYPAGHAVNARAARKSRRQARAHRERDVAVARINS
jgi:hypothetical protein